MRSSRGKTSIRANAGLDAVRKRMMQTITFFRPVGPEEFKLIEMFG